MSNYKSYFLKSLGLKEDHLPGGKGDESTPTQFDQNELQMGIKVEMEHTHDADLAKEIAMDHLSEDPQYYSHLKGAGMADELPNGQQPVQTPMMSKLVSPTAIMPTPVIAVGVRGTKTGLLPAGGIVDDPEKARLGGLELVKNLKPNSQGAIANTPASDQIKADGGHFTPDNSKITKGKGPTTNVPGDGSTHPMQVQQLGNKPFEDDGTTRSGGDTPSAAGGGGPVNTATQSEPSPNLPDPSSASGTGDESGHPLDKFMDKGDDDAEELPPADKPGQNLAEPEQSEEPEEPKKGPWGIDMDDDDEEDDEEGKDVSIDIKENQIPEEPKKPEAKGIEVRNVKYFNPRTKQNVDAKWISRTKNDKVTPQELKERFQKLANIRTEGWAMGEYTPEQQKALALLTRKGFREVSTFPADPDAEGGNMGEQVVIVVQKKTGIGRYSGEIDPSGLVNGQPVEQFIAGTMSEAGAISELRELVGRLNSKGTVTPLLAKAQKYLKEIELRQKK